MLISTTLYHQILNQIGLAFIILDLHYTFPGLVPSISAYSKAHRHIEAPDPVPLRSTKAEIAGCTRQFSL